MDWIGIFEIASLLSYWENLVIVQPSSIFGPTQWQRDQRQEERVTEVPAPLLEFLGAWNLVRRCQVWSSCHRVKRSTHLHQRNWIPAALVRKTRRRTS